ncbi:glucokinase, partial [Streptomyces oceani]
MDLGGTKIAAGLVGTDGRIRHSVSAPTPALQGPGAVLDAVASAVAELTGDDVRAVGVGGAGAIDARTGTVLSATDALPGWTGTRLTAELRQRTGLPVAVDNDVRAHALGEAWQGGAAGRSPVLFLAVGTGVGAALLVDGAPQRGARSVAGH